jgi:serralysin
VKDRPEVIRLSAAILLLPLTALSAVAKDGGLFLTGSVLEQIAEIGGDGTVVSRSTTTNWFDKHGSLTRTEIALDYNGDGVVDDSVNATYAYDKHGTELSIVQDSDAGADGTVDTRSLTTYTYPNANQIQAITLIDNGVDGKIDEVDTTTYSYEAGHLVRAVTEFDTNADGIPDSSSVETWTYDLANGQLFYLREDDFNADGIVDATRTAHYVLDDRGNPVTGAILFFDPNAGTDISVSVTFTYDKVGNLIQQHTEAFYPGFPAPVKTVTTLTNFYAHRGELP